MSLRARIQSHVVYAGIRMSTDKVRSTKLKFKGEKSKKKRKRETEDEPGASRRGEDERGDPDTWVVPDDPLQIRGPTFIYHPSDPSPICVNFDSTRNQIILHILDKEKSEGSDQMPSLLDRTPTDVSQVWITTRVAGSSTVNLRTGTGEVSPQSSKRGTYVSDTPLSSRASSCLAIHTA